MSKVFRQTNGQPHRFCLVSSPTDISDKAGLTLSTVQKLTQKIESNGGEIVQNLKEPNTTWIVSDNALGKYRRYCMSDPDNHRAERAQFIDNCITEGRFISEGLLGKKRMNGRYAGKRSKFTEEEDELLCQWLAMKLPDVRMGGRKGVNIYVALLEEAEMFPNSRWALAKNHPWSSWKERYKKQALVTLDSRIDEIVKEKGYTSKSRTSWRYDRQINMISHRRLDDEDEAEDEPDEEDERPRPQRLAQKQKVLLREEEEEEEEEEDERGEFRSSDSEELDPRPAKRARTARSSGATYVNEASDARPGPDEAGPSGRAAPPAAHKAPPKPRPKPRPVEQVPNSPLNTQATLVNLTPLDIEDPPHRIRIDRSSEGTEIIEILSDDENEDEAAVAEVISTPVRLNANKNTPTSSRHGVARVEESAVPESGDWFVGRPPPRSPRSQDSANPPPSPRASSPLRVPDDENQHDIDGEGSQTQGASASASADAVEELVEEYVYGLEEEDAEEYFVVEEVDEEGEFGAEEDEEEGEGGEFNEFSDGPEESDDARGVEGLVGDDAASENPFASSQ